MKSSEIIIISRRAGSTLQKRSLLYKMQKKLKANAKKIFFFVFFDFVDDVDVVQGLYAIKITINKFCIAKMYRACSLYT
jgi:hypothetical protein